MLDLSLYHSYFRRLPHARTLALSQLSCPNLRDCQIANFRGSGPPPGLRLYRDPGGLEGPDEVIKNEVIKNLDEFPHLGF